MGKETGPETDIYDVPDDKVTLALYRALLAAYRQQGRDLNRKDRKIAGLEEENADLRTRVVRDPLTGLLNVDGFQKELSYWANLCHRLDKPLSLIFIDVESFKEFNDAHGQTEGDAALQAIGRTLEATSGSHLARSGVSDVISGTVRFTDPRPARMGGDEYALIVPAANELGVRVLVGRIREAVAAINLPDDWKLRLHVETQTCRGEDLLPDVVRERLYVPPSTRIKQHKATSR